MIKLVLGRVFECFLEDDGTLDTVVSVNNHIVRFDADYVARTRDGKIPPHELERLFDDAIDSLWDELELKTYGQQGGN
jgi:hypothetical protein